MLTEYESDKLEILSFRFHIILVIKNIGVYAGNEIKILSH